MRFGGKEVKFNFFRKLIFEPKRFFQDLIGQLDSKSHFLLNGGLGGVYFQSVSGDNLMSQGADDIESIVMDSN